MPPILWMTMEMSDGDDENLLLAHLIDYAVGEAIEPIPADTLA
jgi:hypothetical protein